MSAQIEKVESGDYNQSVSTRTTASSIWDHLNGEVDPAQSTGPLAAFCFMTGFIDCISFSAIFVWCGFQTGNFAQLALAIARLFEFTPSATPGSPSLRDASFHKADQQALTSLITFNLGAFIGRLGDKMGNQTRKWLVLGTFIQALFTMAAALASWKSGQGGVGILGLGPNSGIGGSIADDRGDPAWTNTLSFVAVGFMSASLGVQGIMGKRLNTQFTTTIVLTTVWVELMSDPRLFSLRRSVITRDHKLIAAASLFFGAFVSRAILFKLGAAGTLGVGVGVRLLITAAWLFVPGKKAVKNEKS
ncbi:hypothetical protein BDN71DRAFT_1444557 [Pleurotus eryngii]|uniref:DUF1275 domain protein n=1 Tax=Pleurotus eryngii TaxID=5323 RepID=A0A9P6A035_PLEER|nr:hypothetical protein BDN71DRAFT_1444557 [Pleurotus eryngii]